MADYIPKGIFKGLTQVELSALRVTALDRIANGDFVSLSGGMKSSTREWSMTPQEMLEEINYSESILAGVPRATRVYVDLRSQPLGRRY